MSTGSSFDELMARLRQGHPDAAREVFCQFMGRLIALARSGLDERIRQKLDPEDVIQSVFRCFFCGQADGEFDFKDRGGLWALLTLITLRKCGNCIEHYHTAMRDVNPETNQPSVDDSQESRKAWETVAQGPTPSQAVIRLPRRSKT